MNISNGSPVARLCKYPFSFAAHILSIINYLILRWCAVADISLILVSSCHVLAQYLSCKWGKSGITVITVMTLSVEARDRDISNKLQRERKLPLKVATTRI